MDSGREAVVHIVDDDESVGRAVSRLLRITGYAVKIYKNADEFVLAQVFDGPGCVLMDIHMPGLSGLDLSGGSGIQKTSLPIIFVSGDDGAATRECARKAGAVAFLAKPVLPEELLGAVHKAVTQDRERRAWQEQARHLRTKFEKLTARQSQIFERILAGKPDDEIATELGITKRTVAAHCDHVIEKLQAESLAEPALSADRIKAIKNRSVGGACDGAKSA
jgi:FixJ family two-component response regulator